MIIDETFRRIRAIHGASGSSLSSSAQRHIIDQDQMPEWHDPIKDEARSRRALVERINKLKTVYASGCTGLTELSAPKADYVDARGTKAKKKRGWL